MGSRMEKHRKKNKLKTKSRKKFKFVIIMLLVVSLTLILTKLDSELRTSTDTKEVSIYGVHFNGDILDIELFGNRYYIDKKDVEKLLKNLKSKVKSLKDQNALVF